MQVQILSVQILQATTKAGKPYETLDIAFKNLTFQGKVEGKKLMPFGANAGAFNTLKSATQGQVYEVNVEKNQAGYNDWTAATLSDGSAPASAGPAPAAVRGVPAAGATNSRGFATPEERAATQVYIVRQSSIANAINTLGVGAKSALDPVKVIETAKVYEGYVFGAAQEAPKADDFSDMQDDIPL